MRWSSLLVLVLVAVGCGELNSPPTAPGITIQPAEPTTDDDLTCVVETPSSDPDGDPITYRTNWTIDGLSTGMETLVVPAAQTRDGEEWTCVVRASDNQVEGPEGRASVVIGDQAGDDDSAGGDDDSAGS